MVYTYLFAILSANSLLFIFHLAVVLLNKLEEHKVKCLSSF
jgi:hypothetical protein